MGHYSDFEDAEHEKYLLRKAEILKEMVRKDPDGYKQALDFKAICDKYKRFADYL